MQHELVPGVLLQTGDSSALLRSASLERATSGNCKGGVDHDDCSPGCVHDVDAGDDDSRRIEPALVFIGRRLNEAEIRRSLVAAGILS